MRWAWLAVGFLAAGSPSSLHAQAKDLDLLGKTRGEWIDILKSHKQAKFRRAAIVAMEAFGPRTVGINGALIEALEKEPEPELRREAALALGRMGLEAKEAASPLADLAKRDKEGVVRTAALTALSGKMMEAIPDSAVGVFTAALKDPFPAARAASIEGLKNLGDKAVTAVPQVLEFAANPKEERVPRTMAIQILGQVAGEEPKVTQLLIAIVQKTDEPSTLRAAAIAALGRVKANQKEAIELLSAVLADADPQFRFAAATSLAKIGPASKSAWPSILAAWDKADSQVRHQFIRLAGMFPEEKNAIVQLAETAEKDLTVENRLAALQELGQLGAKAAAAAPTVKRVAEDDPRATVREAATETLKRIESK